MTSSLRAAAVRVVERTLAARAPADLFLLRAGRDSDERDRRLLAELVYGTLRWRLRLEHVVAAAAGRRLDAIDPRLRTVLALGAFQLLFLDRVPAHAAVSEAVDEARRRGGRGAGGFVNAVLRRIAGAPQLAAWPIEEPDPVRRLAIEQSHPEPLLRRWVERHGFERAAQMAAADNGERSPHLLAFGDRGGRAALAAALDLEGVATEPSALSPLGLRVRGGHPFATRAFARGDFYVQDEASQAAALVPWPRPGERVLDAAAAPGGKGLALLAAEPGMRVLFADAAPARMARLAANARRLGRRLPLVLADAGSPPWRGGFDRVLLDAPCTGTGTLRRHPELRWRFAPGEAIRLAGIAGGMLAALAPSVAPGGRLVHLTCSVEAEENEAVAAAFLAGQAGFEADPLDDLPPLLAAARAGPGRWQTLPVGGHDGFSVAVFRRRG